MNKKTGKIITIKFAGICWECKKRLPAGTKVRWYGNGEMYGLTCHDTKYNETRRGVIPQHVIDRIEAIFDVPTLDSDEPIDLYEETGIRFHLDDI